MPPWNYTAFDDVVCCLHTRCRNLFVHSHIIAGAATDMPHPLLRTLLESMCLAKCQIKNIKLAAAERLIFKIYGGKLFSRSSAARRIIVNHFNGTLAITPSVPGVTTAIDDDNNDDVLLN